MPFGGFCVSIGLSNTQLNKGDKMVQEVILFAVLNESFRGL